MLMKYWRLSVRNRRFIFLLLGVVAFAAAIAGCSASAAPYQKLDNESDVPRISLEDAKAAYDAGNAVIVDARAEVTYAQEHIAGAINIPYGIGDDKLDPMLAKLPKGKKIIVYCS
jgi:3-mercaptopyruvate sulfurtransferase SseA